MHWEPSGLPTQTPTARSRFTPTAQASRWPKDVPVFQATAGAPTVNCQASGRSGRRVVVRMSRTMAAASGEMTRSPGGALAGSSVSGSGGLCVPPRVA